LFLKDRIELILKRLLVGSIFFVAADTGVELLMFYFKDDFAERKDCNKILPQCRALGIICKDLNSILQVEAREPVQLVIIDPTAEYLGIRKDNKGCTVNFTLSPLSKAEEVIVINGNADTIG
jgi:hypothetical protein